MNILVQAVMNQSFIQIILVLLVIAALTGLLVPLIKSQVDNKISHRLNLLATELDQAAALDQQQRLRDYQAKLLDDLDALLWEYQLLAFEPAYYKMGKNETGYSDAIQHYGQKAPALLHKIRVQVSKARRVASTEAYQKCSDLYSRELLNRSDVWLTELAEKGSSPNEDWKFYYDYSYYELGKYIDETLCLLANDFGITAQKGRLEKRR